MTTNLNFKDINAEFQTLCRVPFAKHGGSEVLKVKFAENPDFDIDQYFGDEVPDPKARKHVYANVWERSLDPRGTGGGEEPSPDTWTIDWRQWPPQIPQIPTGLKIPVQLVPNEEIGLMEAVPISTGTVEFYNHIEGILNTSQTTSVSVDPPALLFLRSQVGQFYSVKLRLKNIDSVPRKIKIFPPKNPCFEVFWGSNKPALVPGLTVQLTVNFRPDTNESVNEILFITVEGDGALTVPLVAATIPPPILELDEWDCGCSVISTSRIEFFEIKNIGSKGRFWFLTEDEFRYEYLSLKRKSRGIENGTQQKSNSAVTTAFKVSPSCCKLQRNQKVKIKVKYTPTSVGLQYEKFAMMCDNGEVRWIAVKGMGIDIRSRSLLELRAEPYWTGPPVDLQTDVNCRYSIDLGDLLAGDSGKTEFKAINRSCIPLYFFWSVRPLQMDSNNDGPMGNISFQKFLEGTLQPLEWDDYSNHWHDGVQSHERQMDVKIHPSQGILRQRQEIGFSVSAPCSKHNLGYYGCVISLFVEQVDEESMAVIGPFVKKLEEEGNNNVPIHLDDLRRTMPSEDYPKSRRSKNKRSHQMDGGDCSEYEAPYYNETESDDTEVEVFTVKHGKHGHDKFQTLKSLAHRLDHPEGDRKKSPHHKDLKSNQNSEVTEEPTQVTGNDRTNNQNSEIPEESTQVSGNRDQTKKSLELDPVQDKHSKRMSEKHSVGNRRGEFVSGVDAVPDISFVTNTEKVRTSVGESGQRLSRVRSLTMDELRTYTDFEDVPRPKTWLKNAALLPIAEVEVWLRSVPLNIQFQPPFIVATGSTMSKAERTITAFNESSWAVEVNWEEMIDVTGCISCEPSTFVLEPRQKYEFKVRILFERSGKVCQDLKGFMRVMKSTMKTVCSIPCSITTTGPFIVPLTPILNFGIMLISSERMKTLAIKNTGNYPAQWIASVNAEGLVDEKSRKISPFNQNIQGLKLLRVWPTWGVLEPNETLGINVYFSAEIPGEIAASVKIMVEGLPETALYIPICVEVQSPFLFLEECEIQISREVLVANKVEDSIITLVNPTGFEISFAWQNNLIGRQSQLVTAEFFPSTGFVPPRGTMDCILTISTKIDARLRNVFALCIVETMQEPLILKITSD